MTPIQRCICIGIVARFLALLCTRSLDNSKRKSLIAIQVNHINGTLTAIVVLSSPIVYHIKAVGILMNTDMAKPIKVKIDTY